MAALDKPASLGDAPIQRDLVGEMNVIAAFLDETFNGDLCGADRKVGFVLLVFPFNAASTAAPRCNYISNANRADIVVMLKEQIARFEGQPDMKGTA